MPRWFPRTPWTLALLAFVVIAASYGAFVTLSPFDPCRSPGDFFWSCSKSGCAPFDLCKPKVPPAPVAARCPAALRVHNNGSVEFGGHVYARDATGDAALKRVFSAFVHRKPPCGFSLVADRNMEFKAMGRVIVLLQDAGVANIGFLTEPHEDMPDHRP